MNNREVIQKAIETLRARAEAAYTEKARMPYSDPELPAVPKSEWGALVDGYLGGEVGAYCATMHPGLGLTLAALLEHVAPYYDERREDIAADTILGHLLRIARLVNGEVAS